MRYYRLPSRSSQTRWWIWRICSFLLIWMDKILRIMATFRILKNGRIYHPINRRAMSLFRNYLSLPWNDTSPSSTTHSCTRERWCISQKIRRHQELVSSFSCLRSTIYTDPIVDSQRSFKLSHYIHNSLTGLKSGQTTSLSSPLSGILLLLTSPY